MAQAHNEREHADHGYSAQNVHAPSHVKAEIFQVARLKKEEEMVTDWRVSKKWVLCREVVAHGKTLDHRRVCGKIVPNKAAYLKLAVLITKGGKHQPARQGEVHC